MGRQIQAVHLCFKQAQPKICHSPKVDDGVDIFKDWALGRFFHRVVMSFYVSVCLSVCPISCNFFEASHLPSDNMIRSHPTFFLLIFPSFFYAQRIFNW